MEGMASFPRSFSDKSLWTQDSLLEPRFQNSDLRDGGMSCGQHSAGHVVGAGQILIYSINKHPSGVQGQLDVLTSLALPCHF